MKKALLLVLVAASAFAQTDSTRMSTTQRRLSLLTGYNGFRHQFLELGIARNDLNIFRGHSEASTYFASAEIMIDKNPVIGPKLGIWIGNGLVLGLNAIYYTNRNEGSLRFRPELGIGLSSFKVVYGYNAAITNKEFDRINKHCLSLAYAITLKRFRDRVAPH